MTRSLMSAVVGAALVSVLAVAATAQPPGQQPPQQPQPQPQQPTFRGSTDVVRVFVTVTDRDGRLVTTLGRDEFEMRDEGKPQPITAFDNTPRPIRLIVMLDVSGSMSGNLQLLRASAEQLFVRLRADDGARVGAFGHDVSISAAFTNDPDKLRRALPESIAPDAPTPLWRAIDEAMNGLHSDAEADADARPVVLVLSDGKDSGPEPFNLHQRYISQVDVIERARKDGVMIYAIGMRSRNARQAPPGIGPRGMMETLTADIPDPGLARVAEETGGGYVEIRLGQDLGAAFARVADELHSQYLIGFAPPKRDGKAHNLDVRLSQRGLTARARKSYIAAKG